MAGALKVFSRHGYEKATNRQIAEAAGIGSPGLIYHYFRDKRDLFQQMLEHHAVALQFLSHPDEMMALPPRELLTRLGTSFVETLADRKVLALFRLILGEALRRPAVAEVINQIGPGRMFPFLRGYLAHQMELGTLRRTDPGVAARAFIGPLLAYLFTTELFPQDDASTLSPQQMVAQTVEIFLAGMEREGS